MRVTGPVHGQGQLVDREVGYASYLKRARSGVMHTRANMDNAVRWDTRGKFDFRLSSSITDTSRFVSPPVSLGRVVHSTPPPRWPG